MVYCFNILRLFRENFINIFSILVNQIQFVTNYSFIQLKFKQIIFTFCLSYGFKIMNICFNIRLLFHKLYSLQTIFFLYLTIWNTTLTSFIQLLHFRVIPKQHIPRIINPYISISCHCYFEERLFDKNYSSLFKPIFTRFSFIIKVIYAYIDTISIFILTISLDSNHLKCIIHIL